MPVRRESDLIKEWLAFFPSVTSQWALPEVCQSLVKFASVAGVTLNLPGIH